MKKNRPGILVTVQATPTNADRLESILFMQTPTLGVRRTVAQRTVLMREPRTVETRWGPIAGNVVHLPDGSRRFAPEYESCANVAALQAVPLEQVMAEAAAVFQQQRG
jgi:uncharacterized protein (DUF111 family)